MVRPAQDRTEALGGGGTGSLTCGNRTNEHPAADFGIPGAEPAVPEPGDGTTRIAETDATPTVEAVLAASRVLVAVSVRSVAATGNVVTVAQLRVLTFVARRERASVAAVAAELGVHPSNATRVLGRLTRAGLLVREQDPADRRSVLVSPTAAGHRLLTEIDDHRRAAIAAVLARIPDAGRAGADEVWRAFAEAGGEGPGTPAP